MVPVPEEPAPDAESTRSPAGDAPAGSPQDAGTPGAESQDAGIPDLPAGDPTAFASHAQDGRTPPLSELPAQDFWDALYDRRSIRRFKPDPVPRELVDQVMHAGIWAPSSCNYQMWDLIAVDDPEINADLTALSSQMGNAPVNIVVAYGRGFSEENAANIQSASALIQNMSLAAQVLGLGTFWITQTGDAEKVRARVGLPLDRMVIAVLALGWPKAVPKAGPKRRPLTEVAHYNHYTGRPIPSSTNPEAWEPDLLAIYQRARVLNGLRHNKPRAWETRALVDALALHVPPAPESGTGRWLDVLPCTGILTDRLGRERRGYAFDVVERSPEVAGWCAKRVKPNGTPRRWPEAGDGLDAPEYGAYDVVSCLFRLEGLGAAERERLLASMARWVKPGGIVWIGFVSKRSFHQWTERARARRGGPGGVEYVLSPDPNVGPYQALDPRALEAPLHAAGLTLTSRFGCQPTPAPEELETRTRNFGRRSGAIVRGLGRAARLLDHVPGFASARGRFQFRVYTRPR